VEVYILYGMLDGDNCVRWMMLASDNISA